MFVLVSYDVSTVTKEGRRRLRRVAKACLDYGQRVQNSVFECLIDPTQWKVFRNRLVKEFDENEDSLRFYFLGSKWHNKVEHLGTKKTANLEEPLII